MRMGYAPTLAALEPAAAAGHKRIAVIGIPCQVYALRAIGPGWFALAEQTERERVVAPAGIGGGPGPREGTAAAGTGDP